MFRLIIILSLLTSHLVSNNNLEEIKIKLQWKHQFEFAGFYAAKEKGFYQSKGLKVELIEYNEKNDSIKELLQNKIQFTTLYSNAISEIQHGTPLKLIANYLKKSPLALAVKPDINNPSDLQGKTIMASKLELKTPQFKQLFRQYNLTKDDYKLKPISFSVDEFISGEVDAISIYLTNEPYILRKRNIPFNIIDPAHYGTVRLYDVNLVTSNNYADSNPEIVHAFKEATNLGWKYALENKEEMIDIILAKYNTQNKTRQQLLFEAKEIEKLMDPKAYKIGSVDPQRISHIQKLFIELGEAKKYIDPKEFIFKKTNLNISLSMAEKKFIKENPIITLGGGISFLPYTIKNKDSSISGYDVDIANLITQRTGLKIKFVLDSWGEVSKQFKNYKLDGLTTASRNEKRKPYANFTSTYANSNNIIFTKEGNPLNLQKMKDLQGKSAAIQKGNVFYEDIIKKVDGVNMIYYDTQVDMIHAIIKGEADFLVSDESLFYVAQQEGLKVFLDIAFTIGNPLEMVFALRNDQPELLSIFNKALATITEKEKQDIYNRWFGIDTSNINPSINSNLLNIEEKQWLNNFGPITYCIDPKWQPLDYLDTSGEHLGIGADFIEIFSKRIQHKFKLKTSKDWSEVLLQAKNGECDIISLIQSTKERQKYLKFTSPYLIDSNVIVTKDDVTYFPDINDHIDKKFGVVRGFAIGTLLKEHYPNIKLIEVDSIEDGLQRVNNGEIFGFIDLVQTVSWHMRHHGFVNLKISANTNIPLNLSIGVRKDLNILLEIMEKAIQSIDNRTKEEIVSQYNKIKYEKGFDYNLFIQIILIIVLILFFIIYRHYLIYKINKELKQRVKKGIIDLREKDRMMFHQSRLAQTGEMLSMIAHQWRQPLNNLSILNQTVTLKYRMNKLENTDMENFVNDSHLQIQQMSQTIDDFSGFFKPDKDKKEFYIKDIVEKTVHLLEPIFVKNQINVKLNLNDMIKIKSYENEFGQVILNLLNNAKDALIEKNIINKEINIHLSKTDKYITLSIIDNAGGIAPNIVDKIFDPYFSTKNDKNGTGLGLYMAKIIVEDHMGGNIYVDINKSGFTTFKIMFIS